MDNRDKPTSDHDDEAHIDLPKGQEDTTSTSSTFEYVPDTEEERKLVRKIDLFLLPAIWGMYLLSYMVRTMLVLTSLYVPDPTVSQISNVTSKRLL